MLLRQEAVLTLGVAMACSPHPSPPSSVNADLWDFVQTCPVVDNHCHPLAAVGERAGSGAGVGAGAGAGGHGEGRLTLLGCLTEAHGDALADAAHTLAVKRSVRELAAFLDVPPSLPAVEAVRLQQGPEAVTSKLMAACNMTAMLIDDGLRMPHALPVADHSAFCPVVKRVLRIETVAEDILATDPPGGSWTVESFRTSLLAQIDPLPENVAALKSIAAYRCGLDLLPTVTLTEAENGLAEELGRAAAQDLPRPRLQDRRFISFLISLSLDVAAKHDVPLQLHCGFGDRDLDLRQANPLLLRPLLEQHLAVAAEAAVKPARIVLLHCAYPFMREAAYVTTMYPHVFLDCGLVFGKLSCEGMLSCFAQVLEMAPLNKVMFSTDAYGFAEPFYLACTWGRKALAQVLSKCVTDGDLTSSEAKQAAADILHNNAIRIYHCHLQQRLLPFAPPPQSHAVGGGSASSGVGGKCSLVRLVFADVSGQRRTRVVPYERFMSVVAQQGVGITRSIFGFASFADGPTPGCGLSAVGEVRLVPDLATLRPLPWCDGHSMVMVSAHVLPGTVWECCPRATLAAVSNALLNEFGLVVRAGFESEFTLLTSRHPSMEAVDSTPYCSTSSFNAVAGVLTDIVSALERMGINVEQLHSEAGGGQFEVSIAHAAAVAAADDVLCVREAVCGVAQQHRLHATFLPQVFAAQAANGSHVHVSIWKRKLHAGTAANAEAATTGPAPGAAEGEWVNVFGAQGVPSDKHGLSEEGQHFMAGVLHHLPAILALSCPLPNSYERLQPNKWAGAFQCWGIENREAAIRAAAPPSTHSSGAAEHLNSALPLTNFEVKASDAAGQPHLVLTAITAAGMDGLRRRLPLPEPVEVNPADLAGHQTVPRLPTCLDEAVAAFEANRVLRDAFGEALSQAIIAVRKAEISFFLGKDLATTAPMLVQRY